MKYFWENDGEANDQGEYAAVVDMEDGRGTQRFVGAGYKEVADKLLEAQMNATSKIGELSRTPATPPAPAAPDGETPEQRETREVAHAREVAKQFASSEEYAPYRRPDNLNGRLVVREMERAGLDVFKLDDYFTAFRTLRDGDYLVKATPANPAPALDRGTETLQPEGSQPRRIDDGNETVRPRGAMRHSGIRNDDVSHNAPDGGRRASQPQYTVADIEKMSAQQYSDLQDQMGAKAFDVFINDLYAKKKPQPTT